MLYFRCKRAGEETENQVTDTFIKRVVIALSLASAVCAAWTSSAFAYRVSGLVEFTYRDTETKYGDARISDSYWTQLYRADIQSHVWDPRFLQFNAGVGYRMLTRKDGPDSSILDYSLYTSFFPTMKISWDLSGSKSTQSVKSEQSIAGYDVETTTYGGTLRLRPSLRNGSRNNNTGNSGINLPSFTFSYFDTESQSLSAANPLDEKREDMRANVYYQTNSAFDINLDAGLERYENFISGGTYDLWTGSLGSHIRLSPGADLRLTGHVNDRRTENIAGAQSKDATYDGEAYLDFKERDGFQQYYRYAYNDRTIDTTRYIMHSGDARYLHRLRPDLRIEEGLEYRQKLYIRDSSGPSDPGVDAVDESGGVRVGVLYGKEVAPAFPGPLALNAGYSFGTGFSDQESKTTGEEGQGWYYRNDVNVGISSSKWENENLNLNYSYSNQEDNSPINNDYWQHTLQFLVLSRRITRTTLRANVVYITLENTSETGIIFTSFPDFSPLPANKGGTNQRRRSVNYDAGIDYAFPEYLTLSVGATRGKGNSTTFTLSTLPVTSIQDDEIFYGNATIVYPLTRRLVFRSILREEYRTSLTTDTQVHQAELYLDFRFRQLFFSLEYRIRQDVPDNGLRVTQQYTFARLSRPF
jgi:hypothetical protein